MGDKSTPKTARNKEIVKMKKTRTFKEIAEHFKISETWTKMIYYREIKKLGLKPREYKRVCTK